MFGDFIYILVLNGMYGYGGMFMMVGQNDCMNVNFNNNDLNNQMNNVFLLEQSFFERQIEKLDYSEIEFDMEKSFYFFILNSFVSQMLLNFFFSFVDSGYGGYVVFSLQFDIKFLQSYIGIFFLSNV